MSAVLFAALSGPPL